MASQNHGPGLHSPALHDGDVQLSPEACCLERSSSCDATEECNANAGATPPQRQSTATTELLHSVPLCAAQPPAASSSRCSAIPRPCPFGFPPYVAQPRSPPQPFSQQPSPSSSEEPQQLPHWDSHSSECDCQDCTIIIPDARPRVLQHRAQAAMNFYGRRARRQHRIIRERFVCHHSHPFLAVKLTRVAGTATGNCSETGKLHAAYARVAIENRKPASAAGGGPGQTIVISFVHAFLLRIVVVI